MMQIKKKYFELNKKLTEVQTKHDKLLLDFNLIDERNKNLENENIELKEALNNSESKYIELQKELKIINIQLDSIINNYNKNLSVKVTRKKND